MDQLMEHLEAARRLQGVVAEQKEEAARKAKEEARRGWAARKAGEAKAERKAGRKAKEEAARKAGEEVAELEAACKAKEEVAVHLWNKRLRGLRIPPK